MSNNDNQYLRAYSLRLSNKMLLDPKDHKPRRNLDMKLRQSIVSIFFGLQGRHFDYNNYPHIVRNLGLLVCKEHFHFLRYSHVV